MRKGEFPDGSRVLRAKIDMASPNLNLRGRIMYASAREHNRTGGKWCLLCTTPHGQWDSIETSLIRSARWSWKIIARSTTGSSSGSEFSRPSKWNSIASA